jgi:uncharacterized protein
MFLDTSGLLNLVHRSESFFEQANQRYDESTHRLTHSFVLAEFVALANVRQLPRDRAIQTVLDTINDADIMLIWVDQELTLQAIDLLTRRRDKDYSLCDAVSFILMRRYSINQALTSDHHFEQEGFVRLLR